MKKQQELFEKARKEMHDNRRNNINWQNSYNSSLPSGGSCGMSESKRGNYYAVFEEKINN